MRTGGRGGFGILAAAAVGGFMALSAGTANAAPSSWLRQMADDMNPGGEGTWNYTQGGATVNGEAECYNPANVYRTSDGVMHLKTELINNDPSCGGQPQWNWRSGEATGKYNMTGGPGSSNSWMMESRLQIPNANGYWPAFWAVSSGCDMLHDCMSWPPEYDIMEVMFHNITQNKSTTWTGPHGGQVGHTIDMNGLPDLSAGYHTYTGFWFSNYANTLFDGQRKAEWFNGDVPSGTQKLVFNVAVGANGSGGGAWSGATTYMNVDYARIWSLGGLNGGRRYRVQPAVTVNQWNIAGGVGAQKAIVLWGNAYGVGDTNLDFSINWIGGDEYEIKTWTGGYCLDTYGSAQGQGLMTYVCNGGSNQRFYIYDAGNGHVQIKSKTNTGMCLDTSGGGAANAKIQSYPCTGSDWQRFRFMEN